MAKGGYPALPLELSLSEPRGNIMLRVTLAALAVTALLASSSLAGDCATCGYGGGYGGYGGYGYGSRGYAGAAWDGYCGCNGGGGMCGGGCNSCGGCGCKRCCFPLIHNTLSKVGCLFDALLPDPCCRRTCGRAVGCAQPTCGIEPGCGVGGISTDPFIDDHAAPPTPTPMPDARVRSSGKAKMSTFPKPSSSMPMKTASTSKPAKLSKTAGKSVLKVGYDEEGEGWADQFEDAPPAAPASIRRAAKVEVEDEPSRFAVKPVVHVKKSEPANPLRP